MFIVGIVFWALTLFLFDVVWASDNAGSSNTWRFMFANLPAFTLPFAGMTLVACNLAALASRRDHTEELYESLPAHDATRVLGHIGSVWMALIVQVVFVAAWVALGLFRNGRFGVVDSASVADIAVSFVLLGCAAALGVALARWFPHMLVSLATLVLLAIVGTAIGGIGGQHWSLTRQLSIWPRYPDHDLLFAVRPNWWHALYLLGLGVLVAVAAVAHSRRDRIVIVLAAAAAAIAVIAGVAQTRPMSARDADRIAGLVSDPIGHSTCLQHDTLTVCAYDDYADTLDSWVEALTPPFDAISPEARTRNLTMLWREPDVEALDPAVKERVNTELLVQQRAADPNTWGVVGSPSSAVVNQIAVGLWSTGLPLTPASDGRPCVLNGQARGAIALWVSAQGMSPKAARDFIPGSQWPTENPESWQDGYLWNTEAPAPVIWSSSDLDAAKAVLALEPDLVQTVLWSDWPRWVHPGTSTDDLLAELGATRSDSTTTEQTALTLCT